MSTMVNKLNIDDSVATYNCDNCTEIFSKRKSLRKHVRKSHAANYLGDKSTDKRNFGCDYCESSFRKVKTLNLHIREDHQDQNCDEGVEVEVSSSEGEEEIIDAAEKETESLPEENGNLFKNNSDLKKNTKVSCNEHEDLEVGNNLDKELENMDKVTVEDKTTNEDFLDIEEAHIVNTNAVFEVDQRVDETPKEDKGIAVNKHENEEVVGEFDGMEVGNMEEETTDRSFEKEEATTDISLEEEESTDKSAEEEGTEDKSLEEEETTDNSFEEEECSMKTDSEKEEVNEMHDGNKEMVTEIDGVDEFNKREDESKEMDTDTDTDTDTEGVEEMADESKEMDTESDYLNEMVDESKEMDPEIDDVDETFNESSNDSNDDSLNGDIGQFLEVDMADSSSDETILDNTEEMDSSSDQINISGEAIVEVVDEDELDQIVENKKVKATSRLARKRTCQELDQEDEKNEGRFSRRKSRRISIDFDGEVPDDTEEIEELKPIVVKSFRGSRTDYKFPKCLPETPNDIKELLKQSSFFQNKKSLIKSYYPTHKQYDTTDDSLPEGFTVWEQIRPNGKHVDKEFLTPDGQFVLRSKLAVMEYCKLLLGTFDSQDVVVSVSPISKKEIKTNKGLNLFKEKIKKSLSKVPEKANIKSEANEDTEISVVKCLPKGTKVKFTFVPDSPDTGTENQTAKKYSCSLCKKIFLTRTGFDTHVKKDHKNARPVVKSSDSPPPAKKLICSYCKQMFPSRPEFMQHMADDHPDVSSGQASPSISASGSRKSARATIMYPCSSCSKKFVEQTELEEHKKVEHNFQCSNCTETFSSKSRLLEHKRNEHSFKCMKCTANFEVRKTLEEHLVIEHYFKCEDCDIVYESRKSMEVHNEAEHTFRCGECKEVFYTEDRCSDHVKSEHQSCETCEDEFSWAEADHRCYYTKNGISPPTERVVEQNLYQGYFF